MNTKEQQKGARHPAQPVVEDAHGIIRFKENAIVRRLLDENGTFDLNAIAMWDVPREDREQFAQLIGYSLSGASDLGYVSDALLAAAERAKDGLPPDQAEQYRAGYEDGRSDAYERIRTAIDESEESFV